VKKTVLFAVGFSVVIVGITLTIRDWTLLEMVFRGVIGPLLAVLGLVILTVARD
jgi:hypothetical protein